MSLFLSRLLLSVWVLTPFGWGCGSLRAVWFGGYLSVWGGSAPAAELSVREALSLLRWHSFGGGYWWGFKL
jgi:hypothetical protein